MDIGGIRTASTRSGGGTEWVGNVLDVARSGDPASQGAALARIDQVTGNRTATEALLADPERRFLKTTNEQFDQDMATSANFRTLAGYDIDGDPVWRNLDDADIYGRVANHAGYDNMGPLANTSWVEENNRWVAGMQAYNAQDNAIDRLARAEERGSALAVAEISPTSVIEAQSAHGAAPEADEIIVTGARFNDDGSFGLLRPSIPWGGPLVEAGSMMAPTATAPSVAESDLSAPASEPVLSDQQAAGADRPASLLTVRDLPRNGSPLTDDLLPVISAFGIAQGPDIGGSRILRDNPILEVQWRSTISPVTGEGGFSRPLQDLLKEGGINSDFAIAPRPPGAINDNSPAARTRNGAAARDAIADQFAMRGQLVCIEQSRTTTLGGRNVDVVASIPGARPETNRLVEIESKLGRASASVDARSQIAKDVERLTDNASVRRLGEGLERVGRVVRPIGIAIDAVQVGQAFRADGNTIGANTQRAAGGLAGGAAGAWAGAQGGAAFGSLVGPIGTAVGGVGGAVVGGVIGSGVGAKAVDFVRNWF